MNYANIKYYDIANGPGVRVSLFVSGCRNHCKNCFNPETWDFNYGQPFTKKVQDDIINGLSPGYIQGVSLLGGEPFEPENQPELAHFLERVKSTYPKKSVWCYTGYDFDADLLAGKKGNIDTVMRMLKCIDVLVDGRFVEELKNPALQFRGSSNQRVILVQPSLAKKEIVLWNKDNPCKYD
ncbi:MAG: anaerobic ribonucleoside-triphosphate reductase activating protein [Clostridia bacterium]|nr:anaerobic ribonucleoside-triphosphate reductase activating protein [Clostridia bacterium]